MMENASHLGVAARMLKGRYISEEEEFDMGSRMAQIFSGCMFGALAIYMCFSNSTRLKYIQRMTFDKRLNTCCQINTIVAALSAFLNFFQLTEVDNWALPGQRNYTVDVARPIEWILTCPLMQLSLVIMGGPKIPEYRRTLMPALAFIVLLFGSSTLFVEQEIIRVVLFICGCCVHLTAMCFNRQQIIEMSDGAEGLFSGDSEFRKVTLVLLLTWFPFPVWFFLTPEGVGIVDDIITVQMGWACLNIVSKFTLIFFIQRVKDSYWTRVKLTRELRLKDVMPEGTDLTDLINDTDMDDRDLPAYISDRSEGSKGKAQGLPCVTPALRGEDGLLSDTEIILPPPLDLLPLEQNLTFKMEQMEGRMLESLQKQMESGFHSIRDLLDQPGKDVAKIVLDSQESIREKMGCGMMDLSKIVEKANSMLEVKMELSQQEQIALCHKVAVGVQEQLEQYPEELFKRLLDTHDANTASVQSMQESMNNATAKLEELQSSQSSVLESLSGSLTSLTDGWAQQIIKESQAASFTLVTKMAAMEEMQHRGQTELEGRITTKLEQMTKEAMEGLKTGVVEQTLSSTEKLQATIQANATNSINEQNKMEGSMASMVKDLGTDVAKHVEAGIGVFGNSLRAQLEAVQQAQMCQHQEAEATLGVKWDSLLGKLQQQSQKQTQQLNEAVEALIEEGMDKVSKEQLATFQELQKDMEAIAKHQEERQQDTHAVVTSVLEQSCGAKSRAEDCANHLAILNSELRRPPPTGPPHDFRDDRTDDSRQGNGSVSRTQQVEHVHGPQPKRGNPGGSYNGGQPSGNKQSKTPQYGGAPNH